MKILGISCFYHDAAAALIDDGKIVAAAEEEVEKKEEQKAERKNRRKIPGRVWEIKNKENQRREKTRINGRKASV